MRCVRHIVGTDLLLAFRSCFVLLNVFELFRVLNLKFLHELLPQIKHFFNQHQLLIVKDVDRGPHLCQSFPESFITLGRLGQDLLLQVLAFTVQLVLKLLQL